MVPGRKFSTTTSRRRARSRKTSRPSSVRRSRQRLRLLRLTWAWAKDSGGSVPGRNGGRRRATSPPGSSTLITSAPRSARTQPHMGPATVVVASTTRSPARGPVIGADDASKNSDSSTPPHGSVAGVLGVGEPEDGAGGRRQSGPAPAPEQEGAEDQEGGEGADGQVEAGDVVVPQTSADGGRSDETHIGGGGVLRPGRGDSSHDRRQSVGGAPGRRQAQPGPGGGRRSATRARARHD